MTTSKLYSEPLTEGRRCIVICEGFYEWKTTERPGKKKPFFIHAAQKNQVYINTDHNIIIISDFYHLYLHDFLYVFQIFTYT